MNRRDLWTAACFAALLGASSATQAAQAAQPAQEPYPVRPVKLVVGFAAGGATDILARVVAQEMSSRLGQPFVVENKPGAATSIAAVAAARAPADGYTLLLGSSTTLTINPALRSDLPYDPVKSFTHLGMLADMVLVFAGSSTLDAKDLPELIRKSKGDPKKYFYGSSGTGSAMHFAGEKLKYETGLKMEHVPFNGSSPNLAALMANQIQIGSDTIVATLPLIRSGKIKAFAVMSDKRLPQLPDVPTVAETVPGFSFSTFFGLQGPAGLPEPIARKLEATLKDVAASPAFKAKLLELSLTPNYGDGLAAKQRIERELPAYRAVAARANIRAE